MSWTSTWRLPTQPYSLYPFTQTAETASVHLGHRSYRGASVSDYTQKIPSNDPSIAALGIAMFLEAEKLEVILATADFSKG